MSNFELIFLLAQGESSYLGEVSAIMDIIRGVDSGLVLKNVTDHKDNVMSIKIIPTNNIIFFIENIDLNDRVCYIHGFLPTKMLLALDQMTQPVF